MYYAFNLCFEFYQILRDTQKPLGKSKLIVKPKLIYFVLISKLFFVVHHSLNNSQSILMLIYYITQTLFILIYCRIIWDQYFPIDFFNEFNFVSLSSLSINTKTDHPARQSSTPTTTKFGTYAISITLVTMH